MPTTREVRQFSKIVRAACGQSGTSYPILDVDGFDPPEAFGSPGYWTTPNGRRCYYPNAYRRAFGKPTYHCSDIEIVVGRGWLIAQGIDAALCDFPPAPKLLRTAVRLVG